MTVLHRYITLLVLSAFALSSLAAAQEPVDTAMIAKIRDEGLNRSRVYKNFTHMTEVIGPRLTGSPQVKAASE